MARLRIVIAHDADEVVEPRAGGKGHRRKTDVQEITEVLRRVRHHVTPVVIDGTRRCLERLTRLRADLVFNLVESFGADDTKEPHVAAYYDLLGLRYTGSGARGLAIAMDKALAKKILTFHGVRTPMFATVFRGRLDWAHDLKFPVIVKPVREDGSIGIAFTAIVHSIKELMERIDQLHADFDDPVLIEEYIEGREIYVGVLGNTRAEGLPPIELDLSHLPEGIPRIAGAEVKWREGTRAYRGSRMRPAGDLSEETRHTLAQAALTAFQALHLRDYARVDFRLTPDGLAYLIEVNPNPYLHSGAEFIRAARASGRTHPETVLEIVDLALSRYGIQV
jgi:D-alanine-D-alanine ligase